MQNLVKTIRSSLAISQEQFAKTIGSTAVTVNRWENGKAIPNGMAQKRLFEICKQNDLDLSDLIVDAVRAESADTVVLYHGSRNGLTGEIQPVSRERCDFGRGFYMGTDPLQPMTLICSKKAPVLYTLTMNMDGLSVLNVEADLDWAMLIAYYRGYMADAGGTAVYEKYAHMVDGADVITGYIANDRMYRVMTDFFERRITDAALIGSLSALKLGRQYVAVTKRACERIRIIGQKQFCPLELMILQDKSELRRKAGVELADRIVLAHRRDGMYFDEILQGRQ